MDDNNSIEKPMTPYEAYPALSQLSEKERHVLETLYTGGGSKVASYMAIYPTASKLAGYTLANGFFSQDRIKAAMVELQAIKRAHRAELHDRLIDSLEGDAFYDMAECYDDQGNLRPIHDIPSHIRERITAIKPNKYGVVVEFVDRLRAKQMLADLLGLGQSGQGLSITINMGDEASQEEKIVGPRGEIHVQLDKKEGLDELPSP